MLILEKNCRNYASTFSFKFNKNTSVTMQQIVHGKQVYSIFYTPRNFNRA